MSNPQGSFIWYELMTPDSDASRAFYEPVCGWKIDAEPAGEMDYRMVAAPDGMVGGVLKLDQPMLDAGARPIWVGYVCVDDVDAMAAAIVADGGTKFMQTDAPGVGRIALMADPWGSMFYIMKPIPPADNPDATSTAFHPTAIGHCGWNELSTTDHKAALAFYGKHFGWEASSIVPMGDMGEYQLIKHGGVDIGAMMTRPPNAPPPMWSHYWMVADIDIATDKAKELGAQVMHGPVEVPGPMWITIAIDPQQAMFALVGYRK